MESRLDLDAALLKAQVKARLLGWPEEPVRLGRFEIETCLGRGGVGSVYAARDTASGARVALKRLHASAVAAFPHGSAPALSSVAMLRNEFRALSSIVHPNLVALHELFCVRGQWFLTMELVEGVDLITHLRAQGPAERGSAGEQALRDRFAQLLAGVAAIHEGGKIHRDLKPRNVLITRSGRSVILDYGLVVDQGGLLDDPVQAGTPAYMAPEICAAGHVLPAADLYAVGTMLFLSLTGRLPARSADPREPVPEALLRPSAWAPSLAEDLDQLCVELLAHDPARRPTPQQARARVLGRGERSSRPSSGVHEIAPVPVYHEPFVGRHAQLQALRTAFAALGEGPSVAWVFGASGMGKSALLRRFCAEQRGAGCFVLEARCYERENTPFKVFDGVAESLVRYLERMPAGELERMLPSRAGALLYVFPAFARLSVLHEDRPSTPRVADPLEQQRIAFSALRVLLQRCCELQPLLIAVDDLQWGDVDSVRLFQSLLAPPAAPRHLFVGAFRSDEADTSPFLRGALSPAVLGGPSCPVLELAIDHLDADEVAALVRQVVARNPGALDLERLLPSIRQARGMPFLLCELLQQGVRDGQAAAVPHRIEDFVSSRVARCSTSGQRLLDVLCVAGRPLGLSLALQAAALDDGAWPAASELCSLRLARWRDTDGERCVEPYHDYVRQTVLDRTSADASRAVQSGIAAAMQRLGIDEPEHLLRHLVAAGERERAGALAITAALRAELATAWHRASELYRMALGLVDAETLAREGVRERLAAALAHAAEHEASAEQYLASAALASGDEAARLQRLAAHQLMLAGRNEEGIALFRRLLRDVDFEYPDNKAMVVPRFAAARLRIELERMLPRRKRKPRTAAQEQRLQTLSAAYRGLITHDPERGSLIHAHFYRETCGGDDRHALDALMWEITQRSLIMGVTDEPKVAELVAEARRIAGLLRTPFEGAIWQACEAMYLIHCREQPREGLIALDRTGELLAECPGCYFERSWLSYARDYALGLVGRLEEQAALCRERERDALSRKDAYSLRQLVPSVPLLRLFEGRPEAALDFLDKRWDSSERGTFFEYVALLRRSDVHLYNGDARAAYDVFNAELPRLSRMRPFSTPVLRVNLAFFRARNAVALYWRTRDPALRDELDSRCLRARTVPIYARGLFHALVASFARADGRHEDARAALRASLAELAQSQADHAAMCVRYRLAQLDDDHEDLGRVHQWFARQGTRDPEAWLSLIVPGAPGWKPG